MESIEAINKAEQFLVQFINDNIAVDLHLNSVLLPKHSEAKGEFAAVMMTEVEPSELDGADMNYDIIIRVKKIRETIFTDRNKVISVFKSIEKDLDDQSKGPDNIAFKFERSDSIRFAIDDDFYDMVFSITILI